MTTHSVGKCVAINARAATLTRAQARLEPEDILREVAAIERECRLAILTSILPGDDFIVRMRASIVAADSRKWGKP